MSEAKRQREEVYEGAGFASEDEPDDFARENKRMTFQEFDTLATQKQVPLGGPSSSYNTLATQNQDSVGGPSSSSDLNLVPSAHMQGAAPTPQPALVRCINRNLKGGYVSFHPVQKPHCVHFCKFVEKASEEDVVRVFREIMMDMSARGVKDFQLQIIGAAHSGPGGFFVEVTFGRELDGPPEIPLESCIACQPDAELFPGMTSKELYLVEYDSLHMKVSLDAQGRPAFIITPLRHTEGLNELEDTEVADLFRTAAKLMKRERLEFSRMVLNHGAYRNLPHLHLKIFIDQRVFDSARKSWGADRTAVWQKLWDLKPAKMTVCKFFKTKGWCKYGEHCRHLHPT